MITNDIARNQLVRYFCGTCDKSDIGNTANSSDASKTSASVTRLSSYSIRTAKPVFFQVTYKNLTTWYTELRQYRPAIPTLLAANKIDENMEVRRQ